jgi:Tfp pilus assembly protein PilF
LNLIHTSSDRALGLRRCAAGAALAGLALLSACTSVGAKSETQQANDAILAGLHAQGSGDLKTAADDYRQAIAHDPRNKVAYYDLGLVNQLEGSNDAAEQNYRAALQIDPNFVGALFNLALLRTPAAPSEAETLYRHVISLRPNDAGPHLNLAFLLRSLGRKDEAKAEFAKAVQLDPTMAGRVPPDMGGIAAPAPSPSPSKSP